MPVETGGLVEAVHFACGGFLRFVHCGEVVPWPIPGLGIIKGYFLAGFYSKPAAGERCPPFFGSLCFSALSHAKAQKRKDFKTIIAH